MSRNSKPSPANPPSSTTQDLSAAIEEFVARGGVIAIIPDGESTDTSSCTRNDMQAPPETELDPQAKLQLLKTLVAKGAGVSSLQYSLRMNRKDIRQLALEHGIKINFSRPVRETQPRINHEISDVDDMMAGHAMHYSSLGYTVSEIAQRLGLSIRQVLDIGKAYRLELRQNRECDAP